MFRKLVVPPQIIHFNRVFHYFHHPFWGGSPYFWKHRSTHKQVHPTHRQDLFVGNHRGHPGAPNQSLDFLGKKNTESQAFLFLRDWSGWSKFQTKPLFKHLKPKKMVESGGEIEDAEIEDIKSGQGCELMAKHEWLQPSLVQKRKR